MSVLRRHIGFVDTGRGREQKAISKRHGPWYHLVLGTRQGGHFQPGRLSLTCQRAPVEAERQIPLLRGIFVHWRNGHLGSETQASGPITTWSAGGDRRLQPKGRQPMAVGVKPLHKQRRFAREVVRVRLHGHGSRER